MESQKPEPKSDEIELGQLFSKMGDFFARIWLGFMRFLAVLKSVPFDNKVSFLLIISTSIIIGLVFTFFVRKNYYESTMIMSSVYLNKRLAENIVDKLDALADEQNKAGLARTLNLPDTLADNIVGFDVRPFVSETDLIAILPRRFAEHVAKIYNLVVHAPPFPIADQFFYAMWHEKNNDDPGHRWLRETMMAQMAGPQDQSTNAALAAAS